MKQICGRFHNVNYYYEGTVGVQTSDCAAERGAQRQPADITADTEQENRSSLSQRLQGRSHAAAL